MTVFAVGITASPAAAAGVTATAATLRLFPDEHYFEADLLKGQLVAGTTEKAKSPLGGFEGGSQLDADGLAEQVGKVFLHLSIKDEGDIRVQLLLKLEELLLAVLPGAGLEHGKNQDILTGIVGKGIEHSGSLDPGSRWRAVLAGQIFADGNHT